MSRCNSEDYDLDLPYIATIPYRIQSDDLLPDSVKLFFGQIVGLSRKCGYIWASDEALAKMKNTSVRNVQRWLCLLENRGYLKRQTQNVPVAKKEGSDFHWEKKRKIFVQHAFIESEIIPYDQPLESESVEPAKIGGTIEPAKIGGTIEPAKIGVINIELLDESLKLQPDCVKNAIVVSLEKLEISDKIRVKISQDYDPIEIDLAVERCLRWKGRPSDEVGIFTTLSRASDWCDTPTVEEKKDSNLEFLKSLQNLDGRMIAQSKVSIGNKYIEFIAGMKVIVYDIDDLEFKKKVTEHIEFLKSL